MRKISLAVSLVALMAASPAFADPDNSSVIDQVGNVFDSSVAVTQTGLDGHENISTVRQDGTSHAIATVTQVNTGQTNDSDIQQSGRRGTAIVEQNTEGLGASGGDNTSQILQHGTGITELGRNTASVSQEGNVLSNTSLIDQNGRALTATVNQRGNQATNSSTIDQDGTGNEIEVNQRGFGNTNTSEVTQDATGSSVTVTQGKGSAGTDNDNDSIVSQFADFSSISVTQGENTHGLHHYSSVYQDGSFNSVTVVQD